MARRKIDESEALQPGWAAEREPLEDQRAPTLNTPGSVYGWAAKATARSGPHYAPGLGKSSS
jgi:hypothetical protein